MSDNNDPGQPPPAYVLTLRPLPSDVPAVIRLRRILKALLRTYDFRCEAIEQAGEPMDTHNTKSETQSHTADSSCSKEPA